MEITSKSKGVVVKLWDIKNNKGADGKSDIAASIKYIEDEEKTSMKADLPDENLKNSLVYATNDLKTMHKALVGSYLIKDIENAAAEMTEVKTMFGKTKGRTALHGIISVDENESGIENAGKLISMTRDILVALFPNHQFVYAVHTNTENLHIHFIVNSVGLDGNKIHRDNKFISDVLQPTVNQKAMEYGFTPNESWIKKKSKDELTFVERKILLRQDIDRAIERAVNFEEFCQNLRDIGYRVNVGKHISLKDDTMQKAIRTKQLGERYTSEAIEKRIAERQLAFNYVKATNHTETIELEDSSYFLPKMPKFKDMTDKQKEEVIKLLKQGRNPWQEYYIKGWQYQRINRNINLQTNAIKLINAYCNTGNPADAMEEIIKRQKEITAQRKEISNNIKNYKPIEDIYRQLQRIQAKSYLYEFCNITEYKTQHEEYLELVRRLKEGYNKTPEEVYEFLVNQKHQIKLLESQREELNSEYKAIRRYLTNDIYLARKAGVNLNLSEITEYYDEVLNADKTGVTVSDTKYIASKGGQYVVRMTKSPYIDEKGKPKQEVELTVLDKYGMEVERISLTESDGLRDFNVKVHKLSTKYDFSDCYKYSTFKEAKGILGSDEMYTETSKPSNKKNKSMKAFMAAVNMLSAKREIGEHFFINETNPEYVCKVVTTQASIHLEAIDYKGDVVEKINVPGLHERTYDGYEALVEFRDRYGFDDMLHNFETEEEARTQQQIKSSEENETKRIQQAR